MLNEEIQKAHVVCVVYAVDDDDTLDRITSHWLPYIRNAISADQRKPVVLVGNKVDLVEHSTIDVSNLLDFYSLRVLSNDFVCFQIVLTIMEDFPEVESCVECSAKTLHNISEMFYYAQKAVLHPTSPLYIMEEEDVSLLYFVCLR